MGFATAVLNFFAILLPPEACAWVSADLILPEAVAYSRWLHY
jgi:hypothetical protein